MTIATATVTAGSNSNATAHKVKTFSGRPNPVNVAYEKKNGELEARIAVCKAKLDDLFLGGSGKALSEAERATRNEVVEQLKVLREQVKSQIDVKKRLGDQVAKLREELKARSGKIQEAKEKLPFKSIADIDRRIKESEGLIETGTLSLAEEKQTLLEISKLNKMKKSFDSLDSSAGDVSSLKLKLEMLKGQLADQDAKINNTKKKIDELNAKMDSINGAKMEAKAARQERQEKIDKLKKELDQLYQDRRAAYEEYKAAKKAQFEARERREAKRAEYERRRELEDKLEDLEEKLLAFNGETATDKKVKECNNLVIFFNEIAKGGEGEEKGNEVEAASLPNGKKPEIRQLKKSATLANAEVISKDGDEWFFAPKPTKKAAASSTSGNNVAAANMQLGKKLPLHIITGLADLSLNIPLSVDQLPSLFTTIEAKKKSFLAKQDDSVVEMEKKRQALVDQIDALKKQLAEPIKVNTSESAVAATEEAVTEEEDA